QLEKLFEPFYRLDPSRSRDSGGSGLGLTIARRMAERAGAHLTLANADGGGLEATLTFPQP
ncbi:ATP-binding protein, partial [Brevundimonas sp.]